jgi:SAM-dependent methyltransferase
MIDKNYQARFDSATVAAKKKLWEVLVERFLRAYVPTDASVADFGGGYCEFINTIRCRRKYVIDLNPAAYRYADPDVGFIISDASKISSLPEDSLDIAFASTFFEHLPSKQQLLEVLSGIHRLLRRGGKLLIIQPNIKYAYREYWDFIDHYLPLTEKSLGEALIINGFKISECIPQFLPFSVSSSPSKSSTLLSLYLKIPPVWRIFGKQTFMVGVKP